jgi:hypothetical protein
VNTAVEKSWRETNTDFSIDLEKLLIDLGAVQRNDQRLQKKNEEDADAPKSTIRQGKPTGGDDDDSDWD